MHLYSEIRESLESAAGVTAFNEDLRANINDKSPSEANHNSSGGMVRFDTRRITPIVIHSAPHRIEDSIIKEEL